METANQTIPVKFLIPYAQQIANVHAKQTILKVYSVKLMGHVYRVSRNL